MDRSTTIASSGKFVFDEVSNVLFSIGAGRVTRWDATTGQFLSAIEIGANLSGIAISPDGRYLLVGSADLVPTPGGGGGNSVALFRIDLTTMAQTTITTPQAFYEGGVADIVIDADGTALFTTYFQGSGWTPLRSFDVAAASPTMSTVTDQADVTGGTALIRSQNGEFVLILESNSSNAPFSLYSADQDRVIASSDLYRIGQSGFNDGRGDVSNAGDIAIITYNTFVIYDRDLNVVRNFTSQQSAGSIADAQFSADGKFLFVLNIGSDVLEVIRVSDWSLFQSFPLGVDLHPTGNGSIYNGLDLIDDGALLLLTTAAGVRVIDVAHFVGATLTGTSASDQLSGALGNDTLNGEGGDDILAGGGGVDVLNGGAGFDTADYSQAAAGVTARLDIMRATNDGDGGTDTFTSIEAITGSAFNDLLVGGSLGDTLRGGLGADTLLGQGGNDVLWGGAGAANQLQGGLGDDYYVLEANDSVIELAGQGTDTVEARIAVHTLANHVENLIFGGVGNFTGTGNSGNNTITGGAGDDVLRGRGGTDVLIGGLGMDTADYSFAAAGVHARLDNMRAVNDGDGGTDTYVGIEAIVGSNFNDLLVGGGLGDRLSGGFGADTLLGFAGNDILAGGQGAANQLQGGAGDDLYILDAYDTVVELAGQGHDTIEARVGAVNMAANVEDMYYVGFNKFYGTGNALDNVITGGIGDDILKGMGGNDTLRGGAGLDEAQFRGSIAQYTVTAEGAGWRIVDSVAGRDGSTYVESIELIRFLDGNTATELTYPGGAPAAPAAPDPGGKARLDAEVLPALFDDKTDDALVLPGLAFDKADEAFVLPALPDDQPLVLPGLDALKDADQPLILPDAEDATPLFLTLEARLTLSGDWMLTMDGELAPRHGDWMS